MTQPFFLVINQNEEDRWSSKIFINYLVVNFHKIIFEYNTTFMVFYTPN